MPEEKKMKYKQQHAMLKAAYNTQLKSFYDEHPDAKLPPKNTSTSKYVPPHVYLRVCVCVFAVRGVFCVLGPRGVYLKHRMKRKKKSR